MYRVVEDASKVSAALQKWKSLLSLEGQPITRTITFPSGSKKCQLIWLPQHRFWAHLDGGWCTYGYSKIEPGDPVNITLEINPRSRRTWGRILVDSKGKQLLAHKGGRGGGRSRQVSRLEFRRRIRGIEVAQATWQDEATEELFVLGSVAETKTLDRVAKYLKQAEKLAVEASERAKFGELLDYAEGLTDAPPGSTETRQEIQARLGQGKFRKEVLKRWKCVCAVSGIRNATLIRASHVRPWKKCESEKDRLDPANGLPLIPNYDTLFDKGFISFKDTGEMLVSSRLSRSERNKFGIPKQLTRALDDNEVEFMSYHRKHVFR